MAPAKSGFSIRCPHCSQWSDWSRHPNEVALDNQAEIEDILSGLAEDPLNYTHSKLLRCRQPSWSCPVSFDAFIFRSETDAFHFGQQVVSWSTKREFRLFKRDRRSRWDSFFGLLLATGPVSRQRDIELEYLLDRDLLSHALDGIGTELSAPVTIYAARTFGMPSGTTKTVWSPIEGYSRVPGPVPPRYNSFCRDCRRATMNRLLRTFDRMVTTSSCPIHLAKDDLCDGRPAACRQGDWSHCPAFLLARVEQCPCYRSDTAIIATLEREWRSGRLDPIGLVADCWAGLTECAVPIIVHDHLVGVAMMGQFAVRGHSLPDIALVVERHPLMKRYRSSLAHTIAGWTKALSGGRPLQPPLVTSQNLYALRRRLARAVREVEEIAGKRYVGLRTRGELLFQQEILGRLRIHAIDGGFFENNVVFFLERMRAFWAFRAVYLLARPARTDTIHVVAFSHTEGNKSYGYPGRPLGAIPPDREPQHATPFLLDLRSPLPAHNAYVQAFAVKLRSAILDRELIVPPGRFYFLVLLPDAELSYAFLFCSRDEDAVSPLRPLERGGISALCQEAILSTCSAVVDRFAEMRRADVERRLRTWQEFSAMASHRIGNEVYALGTLLDVIGEELVGHEKWGSGWMTDWSVMTGNVRGIKGMLQDLKALTGVNPRMEEVVVPEVLRRATRGIVVAVEVSLAEGTGEDDYRVRARNAIS